MSPSAARLPVGGGLLALVRATACRVSSGCLARPAGCARVGEAVLLQVDWSREAAADVGEDGHGHWPAGSLWLGIPRAGLGISHALR
eukprot:5684357-Alexandrium_andersonii.AAC.1